MIAVSTEGIQIILGVLGAGGVAGMVVALQRFRPEAGSIVVTTAEKSLIVQSGVLERLEAENARLAGRVESLEARTLQRKAQLEAENLQIEATAEALRDENAVLLARVSSLEAEIRVLRRETTPGVGGETLG